MPWPYDDMPDYATLSPEAVGPSMTPPWEQTPPMDLPPDYSLPPQMDMPNDYFSRLAQSAGPQPFNFDFSGQHDTGLTALLSALAGFANAKTRRAATGISETEKKNKLLSEAASNLAKQRWERRKMAEAQANAQANIRLNASLRPTPAGPTPAKTLKQIEEEAAARARGATSAGGGAKSLAEIEAEAAARARGARAGAPPAAKGARASTGMEKQTLAFYNRAKQADETITSASKGVKSLEDRVADAGLLAQGQLQYAPNLLKSSDQQRYRQAQRAFTEARLRKESGAAISKNEYENDARIYFAQPGDAPAVREQKRKARATVLSGLKFGAGPAYQEFYGGPQAPASDQPAGPTEDDLYQQFLDITGRAPR
jgi:hypothetical protein